MNEVEEYLLEYKGIGQDILLYLHSILIEKFQLRPKLNFKLPFYYQKSWVCYLRPLPKKGIEISFIHGYRLEKWTKYMESRGRKMVRSIVYTDISKVDELVLLEILKDALKLDSNAK